jgi:hypothetical protein
VLPHATGFDTSNRSCITGSQEFKRQMWALAEHEGDILANDTLGTSSGCDQQSVIALASSAFPDLGATVMEEWPTIGESVPVSL